MPGSRGSAAVELEDAHLIYKGRVFAFPLEPGKAKDIKATGADGPKPARLERRVGRRRRRTSAAAVATAPGRATGHEHRRDHASHPSIDGRRRPAQRRSRASLDQTWRVVGSSRTKWCCWSRLKPQHGPAETVTQDAASPSRLWLGALPTAGGDSANARRRDAARRRSCVCLSR